MAGNAAGYLCLQVPGRSHLTIIPCGLRANRASSATPPRVSIAAVCWAGRKDLLSPEPCVWFPGWPWRRCLSCRDSRARASRESLLRRYQVSIRFTTKASCRLPGHADFLQSGLACVPSGAEFRVRLTGRSRHNPGVFSLLA